MNGALTDRSTRLVASFAVLAILCACDVSRLFPQPEPPAVPPPTAPPVPPPTPVAVPTPPTVPAIPGLPIPNLGQLPIPAVAPPMPGQPLLSTRAPDYTSLAAPPAGAIDAGGAIVAGWAETRTSAIHAELLQSLFAEQRARVSEIPFHVVNDRNEPNAAAGCSESRAPMLMITSAMVVVCASSAEAHAYDELAGTHTLETYAQALVDDLRSGRAVRALDRALVPGPMASDPRKLAREIQLFDAQVAFILGHELAHHYRGHELAHHYRGHTGCAAQGATTASAREAEDLQRGLASAASPLEQPFEVEADVWGITNVLERGSARSAAFVGGGPWTEEGALLSLEVFRHFSPLAHGGPAEGGLDVGVFMSTHPPSELRAPVVQQAAAMHRPGQPPLPIPTIDGQGISIDLGGGGAPIRLPIPLPIR